MIEIENWIMILKYVGSQLEREKQNAISVPSKFQIMILKTQHDDQKTQNGKIEMIYDSV